MSTFKERILNLQRSDMFSRIVSLKYLPRWVVLAMDVFLCVLSYLAAHYLTLIFLYNNDATWVTPYPLYQRIPVLIGFQLLFFWLFHTYSGVLRYSSYVDASKLLFAVFLNVIVLVVLNAIHFAYRGSYFFCTSSLFIYGVFAFLLLFMLRLFVKNSYDIMVQNAGNVMPVMIYGTQSAAIGIAKMIRSTQDAKYKLVGFIDDENIHSEYIMGVKVYKFDEQVVRDKIAPKAKAVIVSPLKMKAINPDKDLDVFLDNNMLILTSQPMNVWTNEEMPTVRQIKSIQIEDLLERAPIKIETDNIAESLKNKVVMITGAAGSIGSEIVRQVVQYSPSMIVLVDQAESPTHELKLELKEAFPNQVFYVFVADVRNKKRMDQIMAQYQPNTIFHAAAYKHVPLMEDNPVESILVNVKGTKNMADLAVKYKVQRFVMVSTDKAVNPTNVMGASKRIAEIYVQSLNKKIKSEGGDTATKFITTRFGNVLGSNGSVIPHFKKQIEKGGPVTVTHPDIIRYFMTIPEACTLVLEAGAMGNGGEIFIFDMGEPVKIATLARKMIRLAGYVPDVDIDVKFTGLRPGEKLYEELLNQKELTSETHNPKIMVAKVREYDYSDISAQIEELIGLSEECKGYLTVSLMKKIVPEFVSNNSFYEQLDIHSN